MCLRTCACVYVSEQTCVAMDMPVSESIKQYCLYEDRVKLSPPYVELTPLSIIFWFCGIAIQIYSCSCSRRFVCYSEIHPQLVKIYGKLNFLFNCPVMVNWV